MACTVTVVEWDTPGADTWIVPAGVTEIHVQAWGGGGQDAATNFGKAGDITVTPGETLDLTVGGATTDGATGGSNGGGDGRTWTGTTSTTAGGGATDVRRGSTYLLVSPGAGGLGVNASSVDDSFIDDGTQYDPKAGVPVTSLPGPGDMPRPPSTGSGVHAAGDKTGGEHVGADASTAVDGLRGSGFTPTRWYGGAGGGGYGGGGSGGIDKDGSLAGSAFAGRAGGSYGGGTILGYLVFIGAASPGDLTSFGMRHGFLRITYDGGVAGWVVGSVAIS